MTKRTNLFPSLIKTREMNCLKIAGASLLLLCISPQFAVADGLKQDAVTIMQQQNLKVSGVVTDEAGEPLIGVSVLVKGTTLGNITDLNGRFSLDVPEGSILEISYIGYKTQSIKAQREPMNIVLKEDAQKLDEVVVVGFGTQKKVNLTGSVSAVTGTIFQNVRLPMLLSCCKGRFRDFVSIRDLDSQVGKEPLFVSVARGLSLPPGRIL